MNIEKNQSHFLNILCSVFLFGVKLLTKNQYSYHPTRTENKKKLFLHHKKKII